MLAVLIFAAGAASSGLIEREPEGSPRTPLQAQAKLSTTPVTTDSERSSAGAAKGVGTRKRGRATAVTWAANVLGVSVGIDRRGVRLVWVRPTESNHVVVVRKVVSHRRSVVVFRGRATSFRDVSARACTAYRYVIINYDRRGHPSTGVPTSVVTQGCGRKAPRRPSA